MATNHSAETLYQFITRDTESAWDSMAQQEELSGGGNFMFARQAMTLLEWACRVCRADTTGAALRTLAQELAGIEPRYFTELTADVPGPKGDKFELPSRGPNPRRELLRLLFDLIRNGQAHQYQQINVDLADGRELQIGLSGVTPGLQVGTRPGRPPEHLGVARDAAGNVAILVVTDLLYLDIKTAVECAGLLTSGLQLNYLKRKTYPFNAGDLAGALQAAGHPQVDWPGPLLRRHPDGTSCGRTDHGALPG
jgi:hypothetical protein